MSDSAWLQPGLGLYQHIKHLDLNVAVGISCSYLTSCFLSRRCEHSGRLINHAQSIEVST